IVSAATAQTAEEIKPVLELLMRDSSNHFKTYKGSKHVTRKGDTFHNTFSSTINIPGTFENIIVKDYDSTDTYHFCADLVSDMAITSEKEARKEVEEWKRKLKSVLPSQFTMKKMEQTESFVAPKNGGYTFSDGHIRIIIGYNVFSQSKASSAYIIIGNEL
ncbi:MAG TPA: hypothetical protein VHM26_04485, partial [Chitinophagaceae bacterium]|nr:hypothetical protein [Chitinophagaceae bacterium]